MNLGVASHISPLDWLAVLEADPRLFATALDVMRAQAEAAAKAEEARAERMAD